MDPVDAEQGVDRISNLPDPILCLIMSQLPVEEVVRTSVLAKRWRHTWKSVTHLDFNPRQMLRSCRESFGQGDLINLPDDFEERLFTENLYIVKDLMRATDLITPILQSHQNNVSNCRIIHFLRNNRVGQVKEWVEFLVKRKFVQTLILTCEQLGSHGRVGEGRLDLPPGIFSINLRALELTRYSLFEVSPFIGCDNLRILKLNSVFLDDLLLVAITSSCHLLEELSLCGCQGFSQLGISNRKLEFLELRDLLINKIFIYAEALNVLLLDTIKCLPNSVFISSPKVAVFQAYCRRAGNLESSSIKDGIAKYLETDDLLARCSGLLPPPEEANPILYQTSYISPFENLQVLCTSLDLNNIRETIILSYLFGACTRLRKLDITIEGPRTANVDQYCSSSLSYSEDLFWDKKEIFDSISNSLRKVFIWGYRGKVLEFGFVQYLITRALKMEKISIQFDDNCTREEAIASQSILLLPSASSNLSIVLKPGSKYSARFGDSFENWVCTLN